MELGLTTLLRLAWVAATLPIVLASLPLPGLGFFHRILSGFAARGKTVPPSSRKFTVPQRFFLHFYVVAVALTTSLLLSMWFCAYRKMLPLAAESLNYSTVASHLTGGSLIFSVYKSKSTSMDHRFGAWRTVFVLLLMEVQVLRRLYETVNVFTYSPSACMHIFGYLAGIFFYTAAPLSLCSTYLPETVTYACSQVAEFVVKGRESMPAPEFNLLEYVKPLISLGWCQWIGAAIYIWGWLHQLSCHAILGSLREKKGADEYVIPRGDWFEYVSCPHYLAEIVIYTGIVVASGGLDITIWLLFLFVVSNLVFAAAETHRWYQHKFDSYPQSRHAIFPLIY